RAHPLELRVTNALAPGLESTVTGGGGGGGGGRGLAGMARSVDEAGGVFEAGPAADGTFVVSARWNS
ncbi:hypothetical protein ACC691_36555, partial [Rhizobium johnstonii]|uniref:hypothetical protein n=1 Tax=Rhizobium johnstonii TaxID=3019933 RepID=UPI003F9C61C4